MGDPRDFARGWKQPLGAVEMEIPLRLVLLSACADDRCSKCTEQSVQRSAAETGAEDEQLQLLRQIQAVPFPSPVNGRYTSRQVTPFIAELHTLFKRFTKEQREKFEDSKEVRDAVYRANYSPYIGTERVPGKAGLVFS